MNDDLVYTIAPCGLGERDALLVASGARLSAIRARKYRIAKQKEEVPDLYLVDDSEAGWKAWQAQAGRHNNTKAPVLIIGNGEPSSLSKANKSALFKRPLVATRLLNTLDGMVENFLGRGELGISDEISAGEIRALKEVGSGPRSSGKKVLVVDDSESVRKLMDMRLGAMGIDADFAEDGETALTMARRGEYDLIFMDVMLPGIDGYEVCRHIKKNLKIDVKVLMLTSKASRMDRLRGSLSTADDYLTKPLSAEELNRALHEHLGMEISG